MYFTVSSTCTKPISKDSLPTRHQRHTRQQKDLLPFVKSRSPVKSSWVKKKKDQEGKELSKQLKDKSTILLYFRISEKLFWFGYKSISLEGNFECQYENLDGYQNFVEFKVSFQNQMKGFKLKQKQRFSEKWFESKVEPFCRINEKFSIKLENEWDKNHVSLMLVRQLTVPTKLPLRVT